MATNESKMIVISSLFTGLAKRSRQEGEEEAGNCHIDNNKIPILDKHFRAVGIYSAGKN
jgi:hypothetical protein